MKRLAERQQAAADRVAQTQTTAPKPPVKRMSQVFDAYELRAVGLDEFVGNASAEEFQIAWAAREPEAIAVGGDLDLSQVEQVVVSRRRLSNAGVRALHRVPAVGRHVRTDRHPADAAVPERRPVRR